MSRNGGDGTETVNEKRSTDDNPKKTHSEPDSDQQDFAKNMADVLVSSWWWFVLLL